MSNFVDTNIDFLSIRQVYDVFMSNEIEKWRLFTNNFSKSKGLSAQELERFILSRHLESTYKYSGIDFDDFQRALPIILTHLSKIERIQNTYDWNNVCKNLNICAYLVFLWTLWPYKERDSKIKRIYIAATNGNKDAQTILTIPDVCSWTEWFTILKEEEESSFKTDYVHRLFTDIIKRIQYPKQLTDEQNIIAKSMLRKNICKSYTCEEIYILTCYVYNLNIPGNLSTSEGNLAEDGFYKSSKVYTYNEDVCWFNPPKPTSKRVQLIGWFELPD